MKKRSIPSLLLPSLVLLLLITTFMTATPLFAAPQTINNGTDNGAIQVTVRDIGTMSVWVSNGFAWLREIYHNTAGDPSKGSILFLESYRESMKFSSGAANLNSVPFWTPVSNTLSVDNTTITTVFEAGSYARITQTTSVAPGNSYYKMQWDIENISPSTTYNDLFFTHGEDTYLDNVDGGVGHFDNNLNMVYVSSVVSGSANMMGLYADPSTPLSCYFQGTYSNNFMRMSTFTLDNTVVSSNVDAGYSIGWRRDTLAPGETWTIIAYEKFIRATGLLVIAPPGKSGVAGTTVEYAFSVQNLNTEPVSILLQAVSSNGWPTSIIGGDNITLAALSQTPVFVRVSIPPTALDNTGDILTLIGTATLVTSSGPGGSGSDATITAASANPAAQSSSLPSQNNGLRGNGGCGSFVGFDNNDTSGPLTGAGQAAVHLAIFLVPMALLKYRRHLAKKQESACTPAFLILLVAALFTAVSYAHADGIIAPKAQRFHPAMDNLGALTAESGKTIGSGTLVMGMHMNASYKPLNAGNPHGSIEEAFVKRLYTADLTAAYGITQNIQIGINLPFNYSVNTTNQISGNRENDFSIGDIRLNAKLGLLSSDTFSLALIPFINFPSGEKDFLLSEGKAGYGVKAASHLNITKDLALYGNLGVELMGDFTNRDSPRYHAPWLQYAFGASYWLPGRKHQVIAEFNGETTLSNILAHEQSSPIEFLAAWRNEFRPGSTFQLGAGTGLNNGIGAPQWRVTAGLYQSF